MIKECAVITQAALQHCLNALTRHGAARYGIHIIGIVGRLLPERITFVSSQELLDEYPGKTPKEREYLAAKEYGAVFISGIGGALSDGSVHDGRAPDYDDWTLNGAIIAYYPVLDIALELSSMGIRVHAAALSRQVAGAGWA